MSFATSVGNQLATSGLRGAGRTQSAVLKDVTDNFIAQAQEANRGRSLAAAERLFGAGAAGRTAAANTEFGTGTAKAGVATGAGTNAARVIEATGRAIGGSQADTGNIIGGLRGNTAISVGDIIGETIGTLSGRGGTSNVLSGGTLSTLAGLIADERKKTSAFKNFKGPE